jgi:hypothetical protein
MDREQNLQEVRDYEYNFISHLISTYCPIEYEFNDVNVGSIFRGQNNFYVVTKKRKNMIYYQKIKEQIYHPSYEIEQLHKENYYVFKYDKSNIDEKQYKINSVDFFDFNVCFYEKHSEIFVIKKLYGI